MSVPYVISDETAALVISLTALAISICMAAWNVWSYRLNGGRVRVRLERGYLEDNGAFTSHLFTSALPPSIEINPFHLELGVVYVENAGRTAVTISEPSFDLGGRWDWRRLRYGRTTAGPRLVAISGATTDVPVRLDPFDYAMFLLDPEPVLSDRGLAARVARRKRRLRASVRVAGHRLRSRSPRRHAWRVPADSVSLAPMSIELAIYRSLARWKQVSEDSNAILLPAPRAAARIAKLWSDGVPLTSHNMAAEITESSASDLGASAFSSAINLRWSLERLGYIDAEVSNEARDPEPEPEATSG